MYNLPSCSTGDLLCMCLECTKTKEEMVKRGHWVPTKEWEETKLTGEELEEKIKELY